MSQRIIDYDTNEPVEIDDYFDMEESKNKANLPIVHEDDISFADEDKEEDINNSLYIKDDKYPEDNGDKIVFPEEQQLPPDVLPDQNEYPVFPDSTSAVMWAIDNNC